MIIEYSVVKRDFSGIMKLAGNEVVSLPCYKREESGKDSANIYEVISVYVTNEQGG